MLSVAPAEGQHSRKRAFWAWHYTVSDTEYPFIAITPSSTLTLYGSIYSGPIYRSNRSVYKLSVLDKKYVKPYNYAKTNGYN